MPIIEITKGHIDFAHKGKAVRISGELLMPDNGKQHYVVYPSSIRVLNDAEAFPSITALEREEILADLVAELPMDKIVLEIDRDDELGSRSNAEPPRVQGGKLCPSSGFWTTPARQNSRKYFFQGETMPSLKSDYGMTLWQWDADQSSPQVG